MKAVGTVVADGMVGMFTACRYFTVIPDIDDDHQVFDVPLPMIHHMVTLTPHYIEKLL